MTWLHVIEAVVNAVVEGLLLIFVIALALASMAAGFVWSWIRNRRSQ